MTPVEILDIWARACSGLPWLLYRESLLCAVGHGHFPQELRSARVAVFAADLPRLLDTVLPALPSDWVADFSGFTQECMPVQILCENQLLLEIDVLLHERKPKLDAVRRRHNRFLKLLRLLVGEGGFYSFVKKNTCHMTVKRLVSAMAKTGEPGEWYYDGFTEKAGDLYPAAWIEDTVTISCGEETYPAPVGYLSYLREVYGDYETGLFDDLGCGLTEADKVSLKIHQEHCKEALAFIQQLSREFGLRYYLLAGSVLGPVRHGGFIP